VKSVITSMEVLLEKPLGENVELIFDFPEEGLLARTDESHLESAILNLTINARDAMPDGGTITIGAGPLSVETGSADLKAGDYVRVWVKDTGQGMAPEVLEKVFDPFFTTKPIGQGTGLGLSMVYGFARQSGGDVRISSAPGVGTAVELILPRSIDAAAQPSSSAPVVVTGAGEPVLVVEDDVQVRMLVREVLGELGYQCLEASNADEALALLREGHAIDLLVSDVGLPGLDGRKLADLACGLRGNLKVLLMTGYTERAGVRGEFLGPNMDLILKPFTIEGLAAKIQTLLAR
jgi:CheY-like chemotaxis protein